MKGGRPNTGLPPGAEDLTKSWQISSFTPPLQAAYFGQMHRNVALTFALIAGAATSLSAQNESTPAARTLAPSSDWILKYDDDSCRLLRLFGEGHDKAVLILERYVSGDEFDMIVAGSPLEEIGDKSKLDDFTYTFGPDEEPQSQNEGFGVFGEYDPAVVVTGAVFGRDEGEEADRKWKKPDADEIPEAYDPLEHSFSAERETKIRWLQVSRGSEQPVRLDTGPMQAPLEQMRKCTDALMGAWGIDVAAHAKLTRPVMEKTNPGRWLRVEDYPTHLIASGTQGIVQFRLSVDTRGKPTDCHIQRSTRPAEFDEVVCEALMRRARFVPALDANGAPIASYYRTTVKFVIPR